MSLPTLGDFFLHNSGALFLAALVCYLLAWRGNDRLVNPGRWLFVAGTLTLTGACVTLMTLILTHDFSVGYVANYSSRDLELGFLISSFWAGQEGTFLLWMFFIGIMGVVVTRTVVKSYERGVMFYLSLIVLSILVILFKKSPFETLGFTPPDGNGLNPLLQNYWMVIHPPTMFVGFAACALPFAFALTALTQRSYDDWAERSRRWTLFAWLALGVALVEGGYWAYETLGWGGFWAWDPVENSSFIPWIFLAAQIHSTFIRRKRNGMARFGLIMVCLTFLSVLYGTFLTRSGVLADFSVHSFVDLGINNFLVGGLIFFTALTIVFFMLRWNEIKSASSFASVSSRSYLVTLGVVVLFLGGVLTLVGTSAPLLTRFTDTPSAVEMSYYQVTMNPIAIAILTLLTLFPTFKWDSGIQKLFVLLTALGVAVVSYVMLLFFADIPTHTYITILSLGISALWTNGYFLWLRSKGTHIAAPYLTHVGLALLLMGATTSAGMEYGTKLSLPMGETVEALDYKMTFTHWDGDALTQFQHINVESVDGAERYIASTESRMQERDGSVMRIPHVRHHLLYDLYIAPLALETEGGEDPSIVRLEKAQTIEMGGYQFT
ncbi:MAG TPA: cytochrome c biogenesis protein CcsA, partial [candidate division Zixibacteria bacterium]|nr:cytochrome c biogenesis protein CcsA [candidate division Zixibacteria bacterium]